MNMSIYVHISQTFFLVSKRDKCNIGKFFPIWQLSKKMNQPSWQGLHWHFLGSRGAQIKGHCRHFMQESVKEKEAQVSKNQTNTDGLKARWSHFQPAHPMSFLVDRALKECRSMILLRIVFLGEAEKVKHWKKTIWCEWCTLKMNWQET